MGFIQDALSRLFALRRIDRNQEAVMLRGLDFLAMVGAHPRGKADHQLVCACNGRSISHDLNSMKTFPRVLCVRSNARQTEDA